MRKTLLATCGMTATMSLACATVPFAAANRPCRIRRSLHRARAAIFGIGLIWASPFGSPRFDYAVPITKGKYDIVQEFRFGGGTSF